MKRRADPTHQVPRHLIARHNQRTNLVPRLGHAHDVLALRVVEQATGHGPPDTFRQQKCVQERLRAMLHAGDRAPGLDLERQSEGLCGRSLLPSGLREGIFVFG